MVMSASTEIKGGIEVRKVEGEIDEIVCNSCSFHLEQMDTGHWWIRIETTTSGVLLRINLSTRRGTKIYASAGFE
jgi:hypothetical protein